ncbi:E3 ubiquitin protein ligase drip2 [Thalictrum thalictroides]|uniref:E3 ubiquitin protein ligase drip2 n=1 Tax=Thalictrum thalictroides TaxID=46969 RepID=A0A7J6VA42_THATH|nr:E3 ubiquitin protein ligase drip2 [Thalictrum thalictroides]
MAVKYLRGRRSVLKECFTCPICHALLKEASTISECLHTYCKKCIIEKLKPRVAKGCPVCKVDLGCNPVDKLRADHDLQDIRSKVFSSDNDMVNAPEVAPSMSVPSRRRERSLSSLSAIVPQAQFSLTGRRTKAVARKAGALRGSIFSSGELVRKIDDNSLGNSSKTNQNRRQNLSISEPSKCHISRRHADNGDEPQAGKVNAREPLGRLVEVVKGQDCFARANATDASNNEIDRRRNKGKELANESMGQNENNGTNEVSSELINPKKMNKRGRRKGTSLKDQGVSAQAVLDAMSVQQNRQSKWIWFSLVASPDQEEYGSLPQITPRYLRIKDRDRGMTVVSIQKYLMMKLNLPSEKEVDVWCFGQLIPPTMQVKVLLNQWLQATAAPERVHATTGASAERFVMVLHYARNFQNS